MSQQKAAGYIRVSTPGQAKEGESLEAQRKAIEAYIKSKDWKLVEIYSDAGISGKTMKKRQGLQRLLSDAQDKKFDAVIITRVTRFGRSTLDTLNNMEMLKKSDIKLISLAEMLDFDTPMGGMVFTMLAGFAKLENEMRTQQVMLGKINSARKGHAIGPRPYGRVYNKDTGEWALDETKVETMRKVATDYLNGQSLTSLAKQCKLDHSTLVTTLQHRCGTSWEISFKDTGETIKYTIPRILDESTIKEVTAKLDLQKSFKRVDVKKYVLSGFLKCAKCKGPLSGQTQRQGKVEYGYYRHNGCDSISYISAPMIENAVFKTIFDDTFDEVGFNSAIKDTFPTTKEVDKLKADISRDEKALKKVNKDLETLIDLALAKTLKVETIREREADLQNRKDTLTESIKIDNSKLEKLPTTEEVEHQAGVMRLAMMDHFKSEERYLSMTYDEKRRLLHWLFDGKDETGEAHGIYVKKVADGIYDYRINAKLFEGAAFLKGDDIDYDYEEGLQELKKEWGAKKQSRPHLNDYKSNGVSQNRPHNQRQIPN